MVEDRACRSILVTADFPTLEPLAGLDHPTSLTLAMPALVDTSALPPIEGFVDIIEAPRLDRIDLTVAEGVLSSKAVTSASITLFGSQAAFPRPVGIRDVDDLQIGCIDVPCVISLPLTFNGARPRLTLSPDLQIHLHVDALTESLEGIKQIPPRQLRSVDFTITDGCQFPHIREYLTWLEQSGFDVPVTHQVDMDADPPGHPCLTPTSDP